MRCPDCREQLDAVVHGELSPDEVMAVNAHIAECAECAEDLTTQESMSRRLKEELVRHAAPDVLRARILSSLARSDAGGTVARVVPWGRWSRLAAAGLVIAVASSLSTAALMRRTAAPRAVADEVLSSHLRSLMPGHLTDVASTDQHNVKPWFNGRVDLSPNVPRLDASGFVLVGGRLDYLASRPVAVIVYARRQHVINVYTWPSAGDERMSTTLSLQGYHFVSWRSAGVETWVVSDLNAAELSDFVALMRRGVP